MNIKENNIRLENNNTSLSKILDDINSLPVLRLQDKTITPLTEKQTIKADEDYHGLGNITVEAVTSKIDSNIVPENIKEGATILGVEGNAKTTNAKITNASYLFYNGARTEYFDEFLSLCENINSTYGMFSGCKNLTELDLSGFDTSNVTDMYGMFQNCTALTQLDLSNFNTSNVTNMGSMFGAIQCTELDLSGFDMSKVQNISYAFSNCGEIVNLKSFKNLGKGYTQKTANYSYYTLRLDSSNNLSHESLIDVITNGLYDLNLTYDVANGGTLYRQKLQLGNRNKAKLTAEEIAIATNKGWDVS